MTYNQIENTNRQSHMYNYFKDSNFEELNDGVILISYTDPEKQQLQFKKISKEELVNAKG